ncbi:MAG: DUF6285 domain-containing protein [Alphaproteobacteria bacterium]
MTEARPAAPDLLAEVATLLRERVLPTLDGELRFQVLVACTVLAQVQRELTLGPEQQAAERARLVELLGHEGELDDLNRELAKKIREGAALDEARLLAHLRATADAALAINNPKWMADR